MSDATPSQRPSNPLVRRLLRKNVIAGLMFISIASLGLWLSRDYPLGTLRRMGTGFMPQMLCWLLMGLGAVILLQGLSARDKAPTEGGSIGDEASARGELQENQWAIAFAGASLVAFALTIERFGLLVAIGALVGIAGLAYRGLTWWETLLTALVLMVVSWIVFVLGLGMTVNVLPELGPWS